LTHPGLKSKRNNSPSAWPLRRAVLLLK
jgi:hypothetical protein